MEHSAILLATQESKNGILQSIISNLNRFAEEFQDLNKSICVMIFNIPTNRKINFDEYTKQLHVLKVELLDLQKLLQETIKFGSNITEILNGITKALSHNNQTGKLISTQILHENEEEIKKVEQMYTNIMTNFEGKFEKIHNINVEVETCEIIIQIRHLSDYQYGFQDISALIEEESSLLLKEGELMKQKGFIHILGKELLNLEGNENEINHQLADCLFRTNENNSKLLIEQEKQLNIRKQENQKLIRDKRIEIETQRAQIFIEQARLESSKSLSDINNKMEQFLKNQQIFRKNLQEFGFSTEEKFNKFKEDLNNSIIVKNKINFYLGQLHLYIQYSFQMISTIKRIVKKTENSNNHFKNPTNEQLQRCFRTFLKIGSESIDFSGIAKKIIFQIDTSFEELLKSQGLEIIFYSRIFPKLMANLELINNLSFQSDSQNDEDDDDEITLEKYIDKLFMKSIDIDGEYKEAEEEIKFIEKEIHEYDKQYREFMRQEERDALEGKKIKEDLKSLKIELKHLQKQKQTSYRAMLKENKNLYESIVRVINYLKLAIDQTYSSYLAYQVDSPLKTYLLECKECISLISSLRNSNLIYNKKKLIE